MKTLLMVFGSLLTLSFLSGVQRISGWHNIVPLHSTRTDVERLLGTSQDPCKCIYRTDDAAVHVDYATAACKGYPPGWNVPAGTVLLVTVRSENQPRIEDLGIDALKYVKSYDDASTTYYTSREDGLRYEVSQQGLVTAISYIPYTKDNALRCQGFPMEDATTNRYKHFDEYSKVSSDVERTRLDNFAVELQSNQDFKGYVIAYAGKRAQIGEAQTHAKQVKDYLVVKRKVDADRIVAMDGGYREEAAVELYVLPSTLAPPTPSPTVPTNDVEIIKKVNRKVGEANRKRDARLQPRKQVSSASTKIAGQPQNPAVVLSRLRQSEHEQ